MSSADELGTRPHVVSTLNRKLKVAINPRLINKNEADDKTLFTQGWENVELTPRELVAKIQQGIAYCAQLSGPRKASNFLATDVIAVDIDLGKHIDEMLTDPIVARHATIIYTTYSHTAAAPRYRIVFALPRTITNPKEIAAASRSLTLRLSGDLAATDATRISFGSIDASAWLFDRQIGDELLEQLIAQSPRRPRYSVSGSSETIRCDLIPPDLQVKLRDGTVRAFTEVSPHTTICCPFHHDRRPSAFVVTSRAGVNGIHCATEKVTFWPPGTNHDVDFAEFEKTAREAQEYFKEYQDWGWMNEGLGLTDVHEGLKRAHIHIVEGQPAPAELVPGVTFVKSPKGSGKTEEVKNLITGKNRVLLIGPR
jgi:hypothetical protein